MVRDGDRLIDAQFEAIISRERYFEAAAFGCRVIHSMYVCCLTPKFTCGRITKKRAKRAIISSPDWCNARYVTATRSQLAAYDNDH